MPHGCRYTMKSSVATRSCHAWTYVFVAIVVLQLLGFSCAMPFSSGQQTIRLCSRSLSDALFLICQGRGYNSPFSYSSEDEPRPTSSSGPGLVDECCLQSCSIKQLEMYCKPASDESNSQDGMDDSVRIVNLPDLLVAKEPEDITRRTLKRKDRVRDKKIRKINKHSKDVNGGWLIGNDSVDGGRKCGSHCRRRRQRKKRRRGKILGKIIIPKVPKFKVGTTSPEPSNRIVMFPLKTYYGLEKSPHGFHHPEEPKRKHLSYSKVPMDPRFLATLDNTNK